MKVLARPRSFCLLLSFVQLRLTAAQRSHFNAIQAGSNFAQAHDGLGACYVNRVFKGFGGYEDYEQAELAQKALTLDRQY